MKINDFQQNESQDPASAYKFPRAYLESQKNSDCYTLETGILIRPHEISMILGLLGPPGASWGLLGSLSWGLLGPPGASWGLLGPPGILLGSPGTSWGVPGANQSGPI